MNLSNLKKKKKKTQRGGCLAAALLGVRSQRLRARANNEIGSDAEQLTRFDDFKLEDNIDRLASPEEMFKDVEMQMK
jgi:hypothetical protein